MHEKRYRLVPKEVEWVRFLDAAYLDTRSLGKVAKLAYQKGIRSRKGRTLTKDLAGRTIRYLSGILDHPGVTPDHRKDCLPKFINHVTWRKDAGAHRGRFEVALFEGPLRADRGRLLREVVEDLGDGSPSRRSDGHAGGNGTKGHTPRANDAACGSGGARFAAECNMG